MALYYALILVPQTLGTLRTLEQAPNSQRLQREAFFSRQERCERCKRTKKCHRFHRSWRETKNVKYAKRSKRNGPTNASVRAPILSSFLRLLSLIMKVRSEDHIQIFNWRLLDQ